MEDWVASYGYIGVLVGTFLEGETTILLAGIFAKFGYLKVQDVIVCSMAGTFLGDCTFFFLGKYFGRTIIGRYKSLSSRAEVSGRIIHQYGGVILFMIRFLAGFRTIILLLLGCANLNALRFLLLDLISVLVWATLVSLAGYTFANVVYIFVSDIKGYEKYVVPLIAILPVAAIIFYRHFIKEKEEEQFHGD